MLRLIIFCKENCLMSCLIIYIFLHFGIHYENPKLWNSHDSVMSEFASRINSTKIAYIFKSIPGVKKNHPVKKGDFCVTFELGTCDFCSIDRSPWNYSNITKNITTLKITQKSHKNHLHGVIFEWFLFTIWTLNITYFW